MSPNTDDKSIIDQTKEFIHNTFATEEQRKAEAGNKTIIEKITEQMPNNASEAGSAIDSTAGNIVQGAKDATTTAQGVMGEKMEQAKDGTSHMMEDAKAGLSSMKDSVGQKANELREKIADATAPKEK